jgi:hypothetical protein
VGALGFEELQDGVLRLLRVVVLFKRKQINVTDEVFVFNHSVSILLFGKSKIYYRLKVILLNENKLWDGTNTLIKTICYTNTNKNVLQI